MAKQRSLDKDTRKMLVEYIRSVGTINIDELVEEILPHLTPDMEALLRQHARKLARSLLASARDEQGVRTCFATLDEGKYINIDRSVDAIALAQVEQQLLVKLKGTAASYRKTKKRRSQLEGQISLLDAVNM